MNKVIFQLINSKGEHIGLYSVPKKYKEDFQSIFVGIENTIKIRGVEWKHDDIDEILEKMYNIERIFAEEVYSKYL